MRTGRRWAGLILIGVLVGVAVGCDEGEPEDDAGEGEGDRTAAILSLEGDPANGRTVFDASLCAAAACHGNDGRSGDAADLGVQVPLLSDASILEVFLNGKGAMPPQASLSDRDLADVLAWLRETFS